MFRKYLRDLRALLLSTGIITKLGLYCISLFPPYIEDYKSFNKEKLNQRNQIIKEVSTIYM